MTDTEWREYMRSIIPKRPKFYCIDGHAHTSQMWADHCDDARAK